MTDQEKLELIMLKEQLAQEKAKIKKFLGYIATYEADMNFKPSTDIEANLKDNLLDIFKAAHKMEGNK